MNPTLTSAVDRIRVCCARWEPMLDLPGIIVEHRYLETRHDDDVMTAADTDANFAHRWAVIRWYLPVIAPMSDRDLEAIVVHEYAHVLLGPLRDRLASRHAEIEEHATENVARALLRVRDWLTP